MQCLTPYTLYRAKGNKSRLGKEYAFSDVVPCGKCPACLRLRQFNWVFRLKQEQLRAHSSAFLTLTYNDEHLPFSENGLMTLKPKDHQLYMKRLRKSIKTHFQDEIKAPIKYYTCGEYGELYNRPHFHSIIFNLPQSYIKHPELITKDWQNGNTLLAVCNPKTIAYTTGYINKTLYTQKERDPLDDRKKETSLISKGIGENYLTPDRKNYYKKVLTPYLTVENGDKIPIPRYYKNKLYTDRENKILQEKTKLHLLSHPQYLDEKNRRDVVSEEIRKHDKKQLLTRKKL